MTIYELHLFTVTVEFICTVRMHTSHFYRNFVIGFLYIGIRKLLVVKTCPKNLMKKSIVCWVKGESLLSIR